jgi:redox-regulated HSP33 family molecular chaperone
MIDEDNGCEVVCKFCGTKYQFSRETLQGFIDSKK